MKKKQRKILKKIQKLLNKDYDLYQVFYSRFCGIQLGDVQKIALSLEVTDKLFSEIDKTMFCAVGLHEWVVGVDPGAINCISMVTLCRYCNLVKEEGITSIHSFTEYTYPEMISSPTGAIYPKCPHCEYDYNGETMIRGEYGGHTLQTRCPRCQRLFYVNYQTGKCEKT